ncbi:hypothetical protein DV735_g2717, partial [Chaetothyriales sp. CBS 134920]
MKFGDRLYRLSPKYSAYNVKYNELKHLIKLSTQGSLGAASLPVGIPAAGSHRWQPLEDDLFPILRDEHNNVALFIKSKQGEIDRRLAHLDTQVKIGQNSVDNGPLDRPVLQARRYQRLVSHAEAIGLEIDQLSQYTAVQKTAFRKILKKYRKWTGSSALQDRLNAQVFSSGELAFDYVLYRDRLATLSQAISALAGPMLSGHQQTATNRRRSSSLRSSNAKDITAAANKSQLELDLALETVPYGEVSGSRYYWIHPDNLEEAESLLLRYMSVCGNRSGDLSPLSPPPTGSIPRPVQTHLVLYDNVQRYVQNTDNDRPSSIAVTARWTDEPLGLVSLSNIVPNSTDIEAIPVKRKDLSAALQRSPEAGGTSTPRAEQYSRIRSYLSEHRDVKPLAAAHFTRVRYAGNTNSSAVGTWATLDSSISFTAPTDVSQLGVSEPTAEQGELFPHAILHIRWEFSRMAEVARLFDTSHLAQRVEDCSLNRAAIYTVCKQLEQPRWRQLLDTDIRKVPETLVKNRLAIRQPSTISTTSSGPLSSDGAVEGVFSPNAPGLSSATSVGQGSVTDTSGAEAQQRGPVSPKKSKKKKRARLAIPPPRPQDEAASQPRYWNEFDDGDSDVNQEETYAIYIDPNQETFPGADRFARVFSSMYDSIGRGKKTVISWLPIKMKATVHEDGVRSPLLSPPSRLNSSDGDVESSDSDTDDLANKGIPQPAPRRYGIFAPTFRQGQRLGRRQKALETTLFHFYTGLIIISYVLLIMAGLLENTGRKKKVFEVNAGVVAGVSVAELGAATSVVLVCMRREKLSRIHWALVVSNVAVIVIIGVAELIIAFVP